MSLFYFLILLYLGFSYLLDFLFFIDIVSLFCLLMLLFLFHSFIFCDHYLSGDTSSGVGLSRDLLLFLVVMGFLVCSYGSLSNSIMCEYLGVVSCVDFTLW